MAKQRRPMLVVYDDYTCEVTGWGGLTQEFDLLTPVDMDLRINPYGDDLTRWQEITDPMRPTRMRYVHEGEVRFSVRERPKPSPGPPYNTVSTADLIRVRSNMRARSGL